LANFWRFWQCFGYFHAIALRQKLVEMTQILLRLATMMMEVSFFYVKVHIFGEGHRILRNLYRRFDRYYIGQIYDGDLAKIYGLLRIYELYIGQ
jgi:hypothetical protein